MLLLNTPAPVDAREYHLMLLKVFAPMGKLLYVCDGFILRQVHYRSFSIFLHKISRSPIRGLK